MSFKKRNISYKIPESTLKSIVKKSKSQATWKAFRQMPNMSYSEARIHYFKKLRPRLMQKVSGRAIEIIGIKNSKTKAKMHKLAIQSIGKSRSAIIKEILPQMEKLIGLEKSEEFFRLIQIVGEASIKEINEY